MTAVEQGRFCAACQKTVTDFTQMTDEEIILFLQGNRNGCGRFLPGQLNRSLKPAGRQPYVRLPLYKKIAAGLLLTTTLIDRSFAQQKKVLAVQQAAGPKEAHTAIVLSGHLTDFQTQKPMPAETVLLKGGNWELQAKTNKWGGFIFHVPLRYKKEHAVLSLSTNGVKYVVPEMKITLSHSQTDIRLLTYIPDTLDTVKVSMKVAPKVILGGERAMVIKGGYIPFELDVAPMPKKNLWQRITHPFRKRRKVQ